MRVRKEAAKVPSDQDSEITHCHVGLLLLVKVNCKIIPVSEGGSRLHLYKEWLNHKDMGPVYRDGKNPCGYLCK